MLGKNNIFDRLKAMSDELENDIKLSVPPEKLIIKYLGTGSTVNDILKNLPVDERGDVSLIIIKIKSQILSTINKYDQTYTSIA